MATAKERGRRIEELTLKSREAMEKDQEKEKCHRAWPKVRRCLYDIVNSHWFELGLGVIILFNLFLVVFETDASAGDKDPPVWVVLATRCLLVIYTTELASKLYVYRCKFFYEMWNVLDFFIVGLDLVFIVVSLAVDQMPSMSILRVFRLVRLARAFKAAKSFPELHSLLRACACALKAIFWGMVMVAMALTVWSILAVQLIHPINKEIAENKAYLYKDCDRCPRAFATVFDSLLTFWKQLVAGDSWGTLCEPIVEEAPWTFLFFALVLVSVNLLMLNCILAVVVEAGAAATAAHEHDTAVEFEKSVCKAEAKLIDLCHELDDDHSGSLNINEFINGFHQNSVFRECLEAMHITEADMTMIFHICDDDDSGEVDYQEFVEQLRRIKHSSEQMILHYVTDIRHFMKKLRRNFCKAPQGTQEQARKKWEQILSYGSEDSSPHNAASECAESTLERGVGAVESTILVDLDDASKKENADLKQVWRDDIGYARLMEKLERNCRIDEELVTIMADVAQQSKVQMGLLNTLAGGIQQSPKPDPLEVHASGDAGGRTANVSSTLSAPGCYSLTPVIGTAPALPCELSGTSSGERVAL